MDDDEKRFFKKLLQHVAVLVFFSVILLYLWFGDSSIRDKAFIVLISAIETLIFVYFFAYLDYFIDIEKTIKIIRDWFD